MKTRPIDVQKSKIEIQDLVSWIKAGEEIILTEGDKPIARIVPIISSTKERIPDLHAGQVWTSDDFDDPLPNDFWIGNNEPTK